MTYRPYPNADRARHQIERHDDETPPLSEPHPVSSLEQRITEWASAFQPDGTTLADRLRAAFQPRPVSGEETSG